VPKRRSRPSLSDAGRHLEQLAADERQAKVDASRSAAVLDAEVPADERERLRVEQEAFIDSATLTPLHEASGATELGGREVEFVDPVELHDFLQDREYWIGPNDHVFRVEVDDDAESVALWRTDDATSPPVGFSTDPVREGEDDRWRYSTNVLVSAADGTLTYDRQADHDGDGVHQHSTVYTRYSADEDESGFRQQLTDTAERADGTRIRTVEVTSTGVYRTSAPDLDDPRGFHPATDVPMTYGYRIAFDQARDAALELRV
jgi:hypothetical protein